jgi:hypothetical protein
MSSFTGLKTINATDINCQGVVRLDNQLSSGTSGQVITSNGPLIPASWSNSSSIVPNALSAGTNLNLTSGNPNWDGSVADTLNSVDTTYQGSTTIDVDITTNPDTINVLKVPNDLTINGTVYNGSVARNITITSNTYTGTQPIAITVGNDIQLQYDNDTIILDGGDIAVAKVPNDLTINGTVYNGSIARNITITSNTYTATQPIAISGTNVIELQYDNDTIILDGGDIAVAKVPNDLTINGTVYNGSVARTITTTDTTYKGGTNINIDGSNNVNLDTGITGMLGISFLSTPSPITALIGNTYPGNQTPVFYMDLTSTTNVLPSSPSPFLSTKIQETYLLKTITTSYGEYSSNFRTSFIAQSSNVMVEFRAVMRCDNRVMYGGLYDYNAGSFWTTPQTQLRFNYNDESDQDYSVYTWWISGLTSGTTYYISPYFKSSSNYSYIYAGNSGSANSFAPGIFKVIDGGDNVSVF